MKWVMRGIIVILVISIIWTIFYIAKPKIEIGRVLHVP